MAAATPCPAAVSPPLTPTPSPGRSQRQKNDAADKDGPGSLLEAAALGDERAAAYLLSQGAKVDHVDSSGWTPLLCAAAVGHEAIVRTLLEHGATTIPLFVKGSETHAANAKARGHATPLHYKELFGEVAVVNMLVDAATKALSTCFIEKQKKLLRGATYGRVLLHLRALQPQGNEKALAARLAAQPAAPPPRTKPAHEAVQGKWSVSYDQFVRDAGQAVATQVLNGVDVARPERRILPPTPPPPKQVHYPRDLPATLTSEAPLPVHDPIDTGAFWYNSADGWPTELEGVASKPTQMPPPSVPLGLEWSTDVPQLQNLTVVAHHADLECQSSNELVELTTTVKRVKDPLWDTARRKALAVATTSFQMAEGRHYIECKVLSSVCSGFLLGVAPSDYDPAKDVQFAGHLWCFDALDGSLYHAQRAHKWKGMEPAVQGDCIGLHLDSDRGLLTVYKNGRKLGAMCGGLRGETLSWVVPVWDVDDCLQITPLSLPTVGLQPVPLDDITYAQLEENDVGQYPSAPPKKAPARDRTILTPRPPSSQMTARTSGTPSPTQIVRGGQPPSMTKATSVRYATTQKEMSDEAAQMIVDYEATNASAQELQGLRHGNEQTLLDTGEASLQNERSSFWTCMMPQRKSDF